MPDLKWRPDQEGSCLARSPGRLAGARNVFCGAEHGDEELKSHSYVQNPQEISYDRE